MYAVNRLTPTSSPQVAVARARALLRTYTAATGHPPESLAGLDALADDLATLRRVLAPGRPRPDALLDGMEFTCHGCGWTADGAAWRAELADNGWGEAESDTCPRCTAPDGRRRA